MEWIQDSIEFLSLEGWFLIVLLGIILVVLALYFRYQTLKLRHSISQLYKINENCQQDALEFFHQSWPLLNRSGCISLEADIDWFGERLKITKGPIEGSIKNSQTKDTTKNETKNITGRYSFLSSVDDMSFEMNVYLSRGGQQPESIARILLITFQNILEQDLMLKQSQILISQKRLERYQLFVQHEIKNIAQFLQLLSDQVQNIQSENQCLKLLSRLESSVPFMAQRAKRTLSQTQQSSQILHCEWLNIGSMIAEIVNMNDLCAEIEGSANIYLPRELILEVFKNILSNYRDHGDNKQPLKITVLTENNALKVSIYNAFSGLVSVPTERMFEPFWTNSESGMGLGLFLARELLKQINGTVHFRVFAEDQVAGFTITIPLKDAPNQ